MSNTGRTATRGWTVSWTFANGQKVTQIWSATLTQAGAAVSANSVSWNAALAPGGTTNFGFLGTWSGANLPPTVSCSAT